MYTATSHEAVVFYNKMYEAVISGKKLSDPELQKEVDAWNYSQSAKFRTSLAIEINASILGNGFAVI